MALQVFESARASIESSRGTAGTPSRLLTPTDITWTQNIATIRPESFRGNYAGFYDAAPGTEQNSVQLGGNLDYSTAAWLGKVFVDGSATVAGSTAYVWAFTPNGTADTLASLVMDVGYGDTASSTAITQLKYLLGNELTLRWSKSDSTITYDANLISASTATKKTAWSTASPTSPTTTLLSTSTTNVYLDASTIGTTVDNNVTTVEWSLSNGVVPLYTLNGSTAAQGVYRPNHRTWTLRVTRYFATSGEWDVYGTKAERKIRVKTTGATLGTATYSFQLDCYGVLTNRELSDADGMGMEVLTYEPYWDTGVSTDFAWSIISADATIS